MQRGIASSVCMAELSTVSLEASGANGGRWASIVDEKKKANNGGARLTSQERDWSWDRPIMLLDGEGALGKFA
jgi:hypothetical protein